MPREPVRGVGQLGPHRGDVEADDGGAVARQHLGDGRADPAGRTGDERDLAGQRALPVRGRRRGARADLDHLAVDVRGTAGEQEPQRRLDAGLGPGRHADQLRRGAAAQLLGGRAREPLERALGDGGAHVAGRVRRRGQQDQPPARADLADVRVQQVVDRAQVLGAADAGRVEHDRAQLVGLVGPVARRQAGRLRRGARVPVGDPRLGAGRRQHARRGLREPATGRCGEQGGRLEQRRARLVPAQWNRVGQAEAADDEPARPGVGELLVAVGHGAARYPGAAQMNAGVCRMEGCRTTRRSPAPPPSSAATASRSPAPAGRTPRPPTRTCSPRRSTASSPASGCRASAWATSWPAPS